MDKKSQIIVSGFKSVKDTKPINVNLLRWLEGKPSLNSLVDAIRAEPDKGKRSELKKKLPAITPSGTFVNRRADQLIKHSGYIALDFDNIEPEKAKKKLVNIVNIFYAGISASGRGVWALIPIYNTEQHNRHFDQLKADFAALGLEVDSACRDVCRLRFYSYDPNPVFNLEAKIYTKLAPEPIRQTVRHYNNVNNDTALEKLITLIEGRKIDITAQYSDWFNIGAALANSYGENGRSFFHRISQYHEKYDPAQTDYIYNKALKGNYSKINAETIFYISKQYGVLLKSINY